MPLPALLTPLPVRVLLAAYAAAAIACAFHPLFDHLGFEFAFVVTIVAALFAPAAGAAVMRQALSDGVARRRPARAAAVAGALCVAALALPTLIILLNGVRRPSCEPAIGAIWMLLLPLPTAWLAGTVGALAATRFASLRSAVIAVLALEVASVAVMVVLVYAGPSYLLLDHFAGYYPGPVREGTVPVTPGLLSFRAATIAWGVAAVTAAGALGSADPVARRMHRWWAVALAVTLAATTLFWGSELRWRMTEGSLRKALGGELQVGGLVLHFEATIPEQRLERFVRDAVYSAAVVREALAITSPEPVRVWLYPGFAVKAQLVGASNTQFAKPYRREIHIVDMGTPHPSLRHELVHAYAAEFAPLPWRASGGLVPNSTIIEGLAKAFDMQDGALSLAQQARAMHDIGIAPDLRRMLSPLGFEGVATSRAYAYAGAFIRWLHGEVGADGIRRVYSAGTLDVLGDADSYVDGFRRMLDTVTVDADARSTATRAHIRPRLSDRPCGRVVERLSDSAAMLALGRRWDDALEVADEACRLDPDDPALVDARLGITIRMKAPTPAPMLAVAGRLWSHPRLDPALEAMSRVRVGDDLWRRGTLDAAREQYLLASALPADPDTRRSRAVRLMALGDSVHARLLAPLLTREQGAALADLVRMLEHLEREPGDALVLYLAARQYQLRQTPGGTVPLIERALAAGLPSDDLTREALRMLVSGLGSRHRCDEAAGAVQRLRLAGGSVADVMLADDQVRRCRFAVGSGWPVLD
jgi:hypothetical protein